MFERGLPLACLLAVASTARGEAWDPPMQGDPKAILAEVRSNPAPPGVDIDVVDSDVTVVIGSGGAITRSSHTIQWILSARGQELEESEWFSGSRVIGTDGSIVAAPPQEEPDGKPHPARRHYRRDAHLRTVPVGSVIETYDRDAECECDRLPGGGLWGRLFLQSYGGSRRSRVTLEYPASLPLRFVVRGKGVIQRKERIQDRVRITWELRPSPAGEVGSPDDLSWASLAHVEYGTASSWKEVARSWSAAVDQAVATTPRESLALPTATFRDAASAAAALRRQDLAKVMDPADPRAPRFRGRAPASPAATLGVKPGEAGSEDVATLLVAQLRALGFQAELALVLDEQEIPGSGRGVLVHLPGAHPEWIDPSERYVLPGTVSRWTRGSQALICALSTRRPEAFTPEPIADSRTDRRDVFLSESGGARIVETDDATGDTESLLREELADETRAKDPDDRPEKRLEAKTLLRDEHPDADDFSLPYHRVMEVDGSDIGWTTAGGSAAVRLDLASVFLPLESGLFLWGSEGPKHDLTVLAPIAHEWEIVVHAPPGYRLKKLPNPATSAFGPASLRITSGEYKDAVWVDAKFVCPTGVIPREDAARLRTVMTKPPWKDVQFVSIAAADLADRKFRDAVAEYRRLADLHPTEAVHHDDLAAVLITAGLGEDARREARKAVELEPGSASAWRYLGWVLERDAYGHEGVGDSDRAGAMEAVRRAIKVDPDDSVAHRQLGLLLLENPALDWERDRTSKDVLEGIAELRKAHESPRERVDDQLAGYLLWAGQGSALLDPELDLRTSEYVEAARLVAMVLGSGESAVRVERAAGPEGGSSLRLAFNDALRLREYRAASTLYRLDAEASGASRTYRPWSDFYASIRKRPLPVADSPEGTALRAMVTVMSSESRAGDVEPLFLESVRPGLFERLRRGTLLGTTRLFTVQGYALPAATTADVVLSCTSTEVEGDESRGWRVKVTIHSPDASDGDLPRVLTWFVVKQGKQFQLLELDHPEAGIGSIAFALARKKDLQRTRVWLDRARDFLADPSRPASTSTDPLAGNPFPMIWQTSGDAALSAASLVRSGDLLAPAIEVVQKGRAATKDPALARLLDRSLVAQLTAAKRPAEALEIARGLEAAEPSSTSAFSYEISALHGLGKHDEALAVARARLAAHPDELVAIRDVGWSLALLGNFTESLSQYRRLVENRSATALDYNQVAWLALLTGENLDRALADATQATRRGLPTSSALHTLAAIQAEVGGAGEAARSLYGAEWMRGQDQPRDEDWYVYGRIAETYGFEEEAAAFYAKVPMKDGSPAGTWSLAQKRLKALKRD